MGSSVRILHVDDDAGFLEVTADLLADENERFEVVSATGPEQGLAVLETDCIDCVVSDYDMGATDGIEFLEAIRERYPDLPFILFTGKGSEEIASEAIRAGVTDYLQKEGNLDQYALLANRIDNAVTAREANRTSERRTEEYETLIENAPVPMAVVSDNGVILYLNTSAEDVLGVTAAEATAGETITDFVHPGDRDEQRAAIEHAVDAREPTATREFRLATVGGDERTVRGSVVPVTFDGNPAAQLVFTDITAQREREAELRERNQFREAIIQNANVWISVIDEAANVLVWNRAATEISGYDAQDMLGSDEWLELLYPDEADRQEVIDHSTDILRQGDTLEGYETTITTADGDQRRIHWDAHPLQGVSDEYNGVISVGWDITEQHQRAEQLRLLHDGTRKLMEATDRETVADFTADAAKDILGYDYTAVRFVEPEDAVLEPAALTPEVRDALGDRPRYSLDGDSPHAQVYTNDERLRFDNVQEIDDVHDREPIRSAMYLPMGDHGVVTICDPEPGVFDRSDIEIASVLVANAEAALDRLERRQEITEVKERLQSFLRGTTDIIALVAEDGTVAYHNPAVDPVLGYDPDALVGESVFEYVHPDDRDNVREQFRDGLEQADGGIQSVEFRMRHADGSWVWLESQFRTDDQQPPEGHVITSRDISERKTQEQRLREERRRFSALFENFPEPTVSYAYDDGVPHVSAVNDAFEETFGYDEATALGQPIDDLIVPAKKAQEAKEIDRRVKEGDLLDRQVRRRTADGQRVFNFRNIPSQSTDAVEGFAVYNDINARVEREERLERQNEHLDEFAGIIAHDLRNPLNVAQTRTELLALDCDSEHISDLERAHDRMETLLEETLLLARQGEMVSDTEFVPVADVLQACHDMVGTDESTVVVEDDVRINCDRDRVKQLFENLISNAIDHGGPDVTIRVGTGGEDHLYVEDDGPGIDTNDPDKLFEPGYTTEDEGTGFGLAIVSRISEAHDWNVAIAETDGGLKLDITGVEMS
jgi:PAS domain S-box-containing protein